MLLCMGFIVCVAQGFWAVEFHAFPFSSFQANVICIVYAVNNKNSIDKVQ